VRSSTASVRGRYCSFFAGTFGPPTGCAPVNCGTEASGGASGSGVTANPLREMPRLPFVPKNWSG
jgi:hypothetical protein